MRSESRSPKLLWDVDRSVALIETFLSGRSFDDYETNALLRSALERQLQITGDALAQLRRLDTPTTNAIPNINAVIGFRNVIVHRYDDIESGLFWAAVTVHAPPCG